MKRLFAAVFLLVAMVSVTHARGLIVKDLNGNLVQGWAPNGLFSQLLTVASTTIDTSGYLAFAIYAPNSCKMRLTPTSAKGSYPQTTVIGSVREIRAVNMATPFVNFSGCTSGEFEAQ